VSYITQHDGGVNLISYDVIDTSPMMYIIHPGTPLYTAQYRYVHSLNGWSVALSALVHSRCTIYDTKPYDAGQGWLVLVTEKSCEWRRIRSKKTPISSDVSS
jgi:hypothetical protein